MHDTSGRDARVAFLEPLPTSYRVPLFNALAAKYESFQVAFLGNSTTRGTRDPLLSGVQFRYDWPSHRLTSTGGPRRILHMNLALVDWVRREEIDTIISAGYSNLSNLVFLLYSRVLGMSFILSSASTASSVRRRRGLAALYRRLFVSLADSCVAYSRAAADFLAELRPEPEAVFLAPNAIDNERFQSVLQAQRHRGLAIKDELGMEGPVVLFVGRHEPEKGLEVLTMAYRYALNELPNLHLLSVGDGSLRQPLERNLRDLRNARFTGYIQPSDLPAYYSLADLLILPSLRETWGFVVNEAMACGLPVIVSESVGCAHDLVRDGINGFVVPAGEVSALCAAMVRILSDSGVQKQLGAASLEIIGEYTVERAVRGFEEAVAHARRKRQLC